MDRLTFLPREVGQFEQKTFTSLLLKKTKQQLRKPRGNFPLSQPQIKPENCPLSSFRLSPAQTHLTTGKHTAAAVSPKGSAADQPQLALFNKSADDVMNFITVLSLLA